MAAGTCKEGDKGMTDVERLRQEAERAILAAGESPFLTPRQGAVLCVESAKAACALLQAGEDASKPSGGMAWGTRKQCAGYLGMSYDKLGRILPELVEAGRVRVIGGMQLGGVRLQKRYNIADLENALIWEKAL